jgi:predicted ATP-grasp superfamily ATP-dependent carboligase
MRVFLYEYTCAAGESDSSALRAEGAAMLRALWEDFGRIPGVTPVTLPGEFGSLDIPDRATRPPRGREEEAFRFLAAAADYTVVVAPEFNNLLETRCRWVVESGGRLLGPSPAAVALAADKIALSRFLRKHGVPAPESRTADGHQAADLPFPVVWKPRHGAGSQATFLVHSGRELAQCAARARSEGWSGEAIVEAFLPGQPASVAFLIGPGHEVALLPARQQLSADGRFRYRGGSLPLEPPLAEQAVRLGRRAVRAVPGLSGYVGVDLVLGAAADGSEDRVIEINPRLTTSYVGLRAAARANLAALWLRIVRGEDVLPPRWRKGAVHFQADGTVIRM